MTSSKISQATKTFLNQTTFLLLEGGFLNLKSTLNRVSTAHKSGLICYYDDSLKKNMPPWW